MDKTRTAEPTGNITTLPFVLTSQTKNRRRYFITNLFVYFGKFWIKIIFAVSGRHSLLYCLKLHVFGAYDLHIRERCLLALSGTKFKINSASGIDLSAHCFVT